MTTRKRTDFIVIHCSATRNSDTSIDADTIREWHMAQGWSDIGYHEVIKRDGTIELGRPLHTQGAHVKGVNNKSVGICLIGGITDGGMPENNYTEEQWRSLRKTIQHKLLIYPEAQVLGHRDFSPDLNNDGLITPNEWIKNCPCFSVSDWVSAGFKENG